MESESDKKLSYIKGYLKGVSKCIEITNNIKMCPACEVFKRRIDVIIQNIEEYKYETR